MATLKTVFASLKKFPYFAELALITSFLICILNLNLVSFDHVMSRDLIRAFDWLYFQTPSWSGPEIMSSTSFRLLGPFYYWLVAGFWSPTRSIEGLLFAKILFSFICFYLLLREFKKKYSTLFCILWAFTFLSAPLFIVSMRQLENASWVLVFASLLFLIELKSVPKNQARRTLWGSILIFLGLQVHLAMLAPALAFISVTVMQRSYKIDHNTSAVFFSSIWLVIGFLLIPLGNEWFHLTLPFSFLWAYLLEKFFNRQNILKYLLVAATFLLAFNNIFITLKTYQAQSQTARSLLSPWGTDNSIEMTLKMKKFIYSLMAPDNTMATDPFMHLHGRAINRMRRDEMNPEQTSAYFGLYQSLYQRSVTLSPDLKDQNPDSAWLFQLRNSQEMALGSKSAFLLTEIKPQSLPQNMVIKYLNEKSEGIEKIHWTNSNLILPFAFLTHPQKTKIVRIEFKINSEIDKYLNLLIDHKESYQLLQVKINSKVQTFFAHHPGDTFNQSQFIYKIPDQSETAKVSIELKVLTDQIPNYSRIDIFTNGYLLASEI